jgi:hypothetical protein
MQKSFDQFFILPLKRKPFPVTVKYFSANLHKIRHYTETKATALELSQKRTFVNRLAGIHKTAGYFMKNKVFVSEKLYNIIKFA